MVIMRARSVIMYHLHGYRYDVYDWSMLCTCMHAYECGFSLYVYGRTCQGARVLHAT